MDVEQKKAGEHPIIFEAGGFIRSRVGVEHPDIQFSFFCRLPPTTTDVHRPKGHGFPGTHGGPCVRPAAATSKRSQVDPGVKPEILFNYLENA